MSTEESATLDHLRSRLAGLDDDDVSGHPEVLDDVHRSIVAALDELGRASASDGARP